jgi:MFS family permease
MPLVPEPGPLRVLAAATLVNTFGNGLMYTTNALYFTRIVGLSPAQVGIGLTCAGFAGMISGIPLGHLGDRVGPRELQIVLVAVVAALTLLYTLVQSFWQFAVLASVVVFFEAGTRSTRGALIARAVPSERRVYARAYLRSITNIGITLGAALAGIALHLDTAAAYKTLIVLDALTYVGAAVVMLWLPHVRAVSAAHSASGLQALRDRPYVAMVLVSAILGMHFGLIEIGMPLWVSGHTSAPRSLVSLLFIVNTVAVVAFQVRASRGIDTAAAGARSMARAGWVLLVACVLFAVADGPARWAAIAILVAAAAVHVYGEILQSAGTFCLTMELAPEHAQGQYQGLAGTGMTLSFMLAPAVVAFLPLGLGRPGWLVLGGLFVVAGMALVPVTAWAERTRVRYATVLDDPPVSAIPTLD